jgi:hypothetical protein
MAQSGQRKRLVGAMVPASSGDRFLLNVGFARTLRTTYGEARKPVCHGFNRGVGVLLIKPFGEQALVNVVDEALNPKWQKPYDAEQ